MKFSHTSVSGFTLTELMVVVAIAGVLAVIAVPGFKSLTQSQEVKNASFDLYSSLILARSEAIKRNTDVKLTPQYTQVDFPAPAHNETGWIIVASGVPAVTVQKQQSLKGVLLTPNPTNISPWVTYQHNGRPSGATPIFTIDAYGETTQYARCIKIELSGMPRGYAPVNGVCQ